jgi:hypothetical protein
MQKRKKNDNQGIDLAKKALAPSMDELGCAFFAGEGNP